jgi:hypothetical protein
MREMKTTKKPLILFFAIIGVCAVLYGAWQFFERHVAENQARSRFTAPVSSGVPDLLHASPAASPLPP